MKLGYPLKNSASPVSPYGFAEESYMVDIPKGKMAHTGGCGIAGCINIDGSRISGSKIEKMITTMSERENGLGAGFVAYGLFPEFPDEYCMQFFFEDEESKRVTEDHISKWLDIVKDERVYTSPNPHVNAPLPMVWRYFVRFKRYTDSYVRVGLSEEDHMVRLVTSVNTSIPGAYCISSGKNMAVFKGAGYAKGIADFYDISRYKGSMWLAHSRFPTNSPGWWAGAHPISILDWSVCHNGEITSYGVNRKLVEMEGYRCSLLTDSEVITYLWDLLVRRHRLPLTVAAFALAPAYYDEIGMLPEYEKHLANQIRVTYKEAFLNGPFSILVGKNEPKLTMVALADRKKLRPLVMGTSMDNNVVYAASEECAIRSVEPEAETWGLRAANPAIIRVGEGILRKGREDHFREAV